MDNPNIRVLIVEDSEDDAYLVERVLRRHGFQPFCMRVQNSQELRAVLSESEWDIVISDFMLPDFNAMGAMGMCRDAGLEAPFVVVSGSIGEDVAVEAMKHGVSDYLMKDNLTRLGVTVERELRDAKNRRERKAMANALSRSLIQALLEIKKNNELALELAGSPAGAQRILDSIVAADRALATIEELELDLKTKAARG